MWHNVRLLNAISNTFFAIFILAVGAGVIGWLIQKPVYALQTVTCPVCRRERAETCECADGKKLSRCRMMKMQFLYRGSE